MRTRVKICGFTRTEDALFAAKLGVDAIGLVFYAPSPRYVSISTAADISRALPAFVSVVALFVDAEQTFIEDVISQVRIDCLQFHGDEHAETCRDFGKPYIKSFRMRKGVDLADAQYQYHDASALLLDAYDPGMHGGTGNGFDWSLIPAQRNMPIILAGGLTPANAGEAIKVVKPYALDVSSGVEAGKGIKDAEKMAAFIRKTNQAITEHE